MGNEVGSSDSGMRPHFLMRQPWEEMMGTITMELLQT